MSGSWAKGSTRRWRRIRATILLANQAENAGRCTLNIPGVCAGAATQVHHTKGKAYGDDPRHLVAACAPCNRHVGDPTRTNPTPRRVSKW
jgi:hypothetical protein